MTIDETIKQLIAQRDSAIYRLIDYRISKGEWKLELEQGPALAAKIGGRTSGHASMNMRTLAIYSSRSVV